MSPAFSRSNQNQKLAVTEATIWAISVSAAEWNTGKIEMDTHCLTKEHTMKRMTIGQYLFIGNSNGY